MKCMIKCWDTWYFVEIDTICPKYITGKFSIESLTKLSAFTGAFPWDNISQLIRM